MNKLVEIELNHDKYINGLGKNYHPGTIYLATFYEFTKPTFKKLDLDNIEESWILIKVGFTEGGAVDRVVTEYGASPNASLAFLICSQPIPDNKRTDSQGNQFIFEHYCRKGAIERFGAQYYEGESIMIQIKYVKEYCLWITDQVKLLYKDVLDTSLYGNTPAIPEYFTNLEDLFGFVELSESTKSLNFNTSVEYNEFLDKTFGYINKINSENSRKNYLRVQASSSSTPLPVSISNNNKIKSVKNQGGSKQSGFAINCRKNLVKARKKRIQSLQNSSNIVSPVITNTLNITVNNSNVSITPSYYHSGIDITVPFHYKNGRGQKSISDRYPGIKEGTVLYFPSQLNKVRNGSKNKGKIYRFMVVDPNLGIFCDLDNPSIQGSGLKMIHRYIDPLFKNNKDTYRWPYYFCFDPNCDITVESWLFKLKENNLYVRDN